MIRWCLLWCLFMALPAKAHVVTQIFGEWKESSTWEIEVLFDAGYAVPEWRGDADTPAPTRAWLAGQGEEGWAALRLEAERYLRECLEIRSGGVADWQVEFIDFRKVPPDFPELLNDGAYFRMIVTGRKSLEPGATIHWKAVAGPSFVMKLAGEHAGYLTLAPGNTLPLPVGEVKAAGNPSWVETFRQGFLHVLPTGLDHILFVMGLFFFHRSWKPLVSQSLAFTVAHTVTLGLASAGLVRISSAWVDPFIALSLIAVGLENLRAKRGANKAPRLLGVFIFGLVHGLGFAGGLSAWIKPGDGFALALVCANAGVEAAQVAILAIAWILTIPLVGTPFYPKVRTAGCLGIALTGAFWLLQRFL